MVANDERECAVRSLRSYRERLRADLARVQEDLTAVERSLRIIGGEGETPQGGDASYQTLGMQEACERLLRENPGKKFKPSVAAKELLKRGFVKKSKTFGSQVAAALNRAAFKNVAIKERINNRVFYSLRDGSAVTSRVEGQQHKEGQP